MFDSWTSSGVWDTSNIGQVLWALDIFKFLGQIFEKQKKNVERGMCIWEDTKKKQKKTLN